MDRQSVCVCVCRGPGAGLTVTASLFVCLCVCVCVPVLLLMRIPHTCRQSAHRHLSQHTCHPSARLSPLQYVNNSNNNARVFIHSSPRRCRRRRLRGGSCVSDIFSLFQVLRVCLFVCFSLFVFVYPLFSLLLVCLTTSLLSNRHLSD